MQYLVTKMIEYYKKETGPKSKKKNTHIQGVIKVELSLWDLILNGDILTNLENIFKAPFSSQKHIQRWTS